MVIRRRSHQECIVIRCATAGGVRTGRRDRKGLIVVGVIRVGSGIPQFLCDTTGSIILDSFVHGPGHPVFAGTVRRLCVRIRADCNTCLINDRRQVSVCIIRIGDGFVCGVCDRRYVPVVVKGNDIVTFSDGRAVRDVDAVVGSGQCDLIAILVADAGKLTVSRIVICDIVGCDRVALNIQRFISVGGQFVPGHLVDKDVVFFFDEGEFRSIRKHRLVDDRIDRFHRCVRGEEPRMVCGIVIPDKVKAEVPIPESKVRMAFMVRTVVFGDRCDVLVDNDTVLSDSRINRSRFECGNRKRNIIIRPFAVCTDFILDVIGAVGRLRQADQLAVHIEMRHGLADGRSTDVADCVFDLNHQAVERICVDFGCVRVLPCFASVEAVGGDAALVIMCRDLNMESASLTAFGHIDRIDDRSYFIDIADGNNFRIRDITGIILDKNIICSVIGNHFRTGCLPFSRAVCL